MFINLSNINRSNRSWNYEYGITLEKGSYTRSMELKSETFAKQFYEHFPIFKSMNWDNLVVMCGAVLNLLLNSGVKDLDFYVVGLNEKQTLSRAEEFLQFLKEREKEHIIVLNEADRNHHSRSFNEPFGGGQYRRSEPRKIDIQAVRRGSVITIYLTAIKCPIQLVLTSVSKEDLATRCDFAVNATHFDGSDVWFTNDGAWEIENMTVRLSEKGPFPKIHRIQKMFDKNFSIILPDGDPAKLDTTTLDKAAVLGTNEGQIDLFPFFGIKYSQVHGGKVMTSDIMPLRKKRKAELVRERTGKLGGYDTATKFMSSGVDTRSILFENLLTIANLSGDENNLDFVIAGIDDNVSDVLKRWPSITSRQVTNCYNSSLVSGMYDSQALSFSQLQTYLPDLNVFDLFQKLSRKDDEGDNLLTPEPSELRSLIQDEVDKKAEKIKSLLPSLNAKYKDKVAPVCTGDEMRDRGSIDVDPDEFYGDKKRKRT